jgi:hypothetical protein
MLASAAAAAAGFAVDQDCHIIYQSILSLAKILANTISSNVKLDKVDVLKSWNSSELWS